VFVPCAWAIVSMTQEAMMSTAQLLDGAAVADRIREQTAERIATQMEEVGRPPCLATVLVGDDPSSATYVRMKQRACARIGITSRHEHLNATTTTDQLVALITALSSDPTLDGILLQHPVPDHVDERAAFEAIAAGKDVDGVTTASFGVMAFGLPGFASCTPGGIVRLLDAYDVPIRGRHAVVVGRSPILGKPVGMLLLARHATVTYCHSRTIDLPSIVRGPPTVRIDERWIRMKRRGSRRCSSAESAPRTRWDLAPAWSLT
jgi:methylenetetrahydrofolate dehydrogenase (NADP+) / methenyltetrahydrofolate cyclohydrolase